MAFERFYITNDGAQYLALAQAGSKLVITKAQIGTGYLGTGQSAVSRTALISPLKDCAIQSKQAVGSTVNVTMQFVNTDGAGNVLDPFWWAEVGLFAKLDNDPDHPEILFAYANAMDEAHADYIPGTLTEFLFVMALNVQNAADNIAIDITAPVLYLATDGDASEVTSAVTEEASASVSDLAPGSTLKRLFGKTKKLISDILNNKAAKVTGATAGNFAGLSVAGDLTDSGKKPIDFAGAAHTHGIADISGGIGGQNLLVNSGFYKDTTGWNLDTGFTRNTTVKLFGCPTIRAQISGLPAMSWRGVNPIDSNRIPCTPGEVFTYSAYVKIDDHTTFEGKKIVVVAQVFKADGTSIGNTEFAYTPVVGNNGKWIRLWGTLTIPETGALTRMWVYIAQNGTASIGGFKIEHGNIPTDWCPSWAEMMAPNPPMLTLIEDYISATLLNGFTGWIRYNKDATGHVTVRFNITPGTTTANTAIAQMPAGYRSAVSCAFVLRNNTSGDPVNFWINANGNISSNVALTAANTYVGSYTYLAEA